MRRKFACAYLAPWQVQWAVDAGLKRVEFNAGRAKDRLEYQNKQILQPEPKANIASCLCEIAASLYLNQSWNGPYWRNKYHSQASATPDIGRDGEVRRTRTPGGPIAVKLSDTVNNLLLVQAYIPDASLQKIVDAALAGREPADEDVTVWLLGQMRATVAWHNGYFVKDWQDKKYCDAQFLEPMPDVNLYDPEPPCQQEVCRVE